MIYLDNAATTPTDSRVLKAMMPYIVDDFGNAGSLYSLGRKSADAIKKARSQVSRLINAKPENIIFTSGGSEANNMVFLGLKDYLLSKGKTHIIVSAVEHDSIINTVESVSIKPDFDVDFLPVNKDCKVSIEDLKNAIRPDTGLVSVMYVNNETGAINPIEEIGEICKEKGILFHTDCVQALGFNKIDVEKINCDFLSMSSHKIHGCKGTGGLYVRNKSILQPIINGGEEQEFGLRGGTENVAGIVAFGKAAELIGVSMYLAEQDRIIYLKEIFLKKLNEKLLENNLKNCLHINSYEEFSKVINLRFDSISAETLVLALDNRGVCVSAGSACRSLSSEPSRTLVATGLTPDEARESIRVSLSYENIEEEIINAVDAIVDGVLFINEAFRK